MMHDTHVEDTAQYNYGKTYSLILFQQRHDYVTRDRSNFPRSLSVPLRIRENKFDKLLSNVWRSAYHACDNVAYTLLCSVECAGSCDLRVSPH